MTDILTKKQRSYNMSQIRRSETKPELSMKKYFLKRGYFYQPNIYGKPDFANLKKREIVFIDGCFWHKCPSCFRLPATNTYFWKNKINENVKRDLEINRNYKNSGWKVKRIWEHDISN